MSTPYTPGTWHIEHHDGSRIVFTERFEIRNERNQMIAALHAVNFDVDGEKDRQHARLIAEAPAMRDLIELLATWDGTGYPPASDWQTEARALLARIDGNPLNIDDNTCGICGKSDRYCDGDHDTTKGE